MKLMILAVAGALVANSFALERLEPGTGCYFGFTVKENDSIRALSARMGFTPAVYSRFFSFPLSGDGWESLESFLAEVSTVQGLAMLTLETWGGLEEVTDEHCKILAERCATWESRGVTGIFIRFAHEMNGSWYRWGQKPILYKSTFRRVALAIHAATTHTAMVWAPNYGTGYPFGKPLPEPGSAEYLALDTDGDGQITDRDDPYAPYYPGDDVVDWVGMTIYHWGISYPWFENEMPLPDNFAGSLTGTYQGKTPNFYEEYSVRRGKPLVVPETAAFYNTEQPGPDPLLLKQAWWRQVFAETSRFPKLKCINWFDELKREGVAQGNWIDWRVSADERIRAAFLRDLFSVSTNGHPYFLTAQAAHCIDQPYCISAEYLPDLLPTAGDVAVSLEVRAATDCDLVIDLLDSKFRWVGGTRTAVTAPSQSIITSLRLAETLTDETSYRWSIFLTPTGRDYRAALAWYTGPNPTEDPDADGASNDEESIAGTAPRNGLDVLAISIEQRGPNTVLNWPSRKGRSYQVLSSTDSKTWAPIGPSLAGNGETLLSNVQTDSIYRRAFYRVQVSQ